jgi:hypothetical protein
MVHEYNPTMLFVENRMEKLPWQSHATSTENVQYQATEIQDVYVFPVQVVSIA